MQDLGRTATLAPGKTLIQLGVTRLQANAVAGLAGGPPLGSSP
jgi:hypothetical protein